VDSTVDATTRTIKLRASVPDEAERLRPGMFVQVTVVRDGAHARRRAGHRDRPRDLRDSVFVVEARPPARPRPPGWRGTVRAARRGAR